MTHTTIRNATSRDIAAIMELEQSAFAAGIIEEQSVFLDRIATFAEGFLLLETAQPDSIIGYISSEIHVSSDLRSREQFQLGHDITRFHQPDGDELYVSSMALTPDLRGQGLGSLLIRELLHRMTALPGLSSAILMVGESWKAARTIYDNLGFREIGRFANFLTLANGQTENVILMRLSLR